MRFPLILVSVLVTVSQAFAHVDQDAHALDDSFNGLFSVEDHELSADKHELQMMACGKASKSQLRSINQGNMKKEKFLTQCRAATDNSSWCDQLVRPNPASKNIFACTYGTSQPHQLIHPNESTWKNAINTIKLIQDLDAKGMKTCLIYNWWRPEPYNKNVGGAAGRHPYGTSVDVRFCDDATAVLAFNELCRQRRAGRIRAIGYYGSASLHFGIGDATANTWGKSCP